MKKTVAECCDSIAEAADRWLLRLAGEDVDEEIARKARRGALIVCSGGSCKEIGLDPAIAQKAKQVLPQFRSRISTLYDDPRFKASTIEKKLQLPEGFVFSDEARTIPWIMSTEARDEDGDIVIQRGLDTSEFKIAPRLLWSHNRKLPAIGSVPKVARIELPKGIPATIGLTAFATEEENPLGHMIYMLARPVGPDGKRRKAHITSGSIGFKPVKVTVPQGDDEREEMGLGAGGVRFDKSLLSEFSIANLGANRGAEQLEDEMEALKEAGLVSKSLVDMFRAEVPLTERDWEERVKDRIRGFVDMGAAWEIHAAKSLGDVGISMLQIAQPSLFDLFMGREDPGTGIPSRAVEGNGDGVELEVEVASLDAEAFLALMNDNASALADNATALARVARGLDEVGTKLDVLVESHTAPDGDLGGPDGPDADSSPDVRGGSTEAQLAALQREVTRLRRLAKASKSKE